MSDEKSFTKEIVEENEKKTDGNYFGKREENAVKEYLDSTDEGKRQEIFSTILKPAFTKMIESLIRRYNLFTIDEGFNDTFNDTLSFLMLKLNKYDPSKGFKAYSYCGTVCKNYLIRKRKESQKNESTNVSFNPTYGNGLADSDDTKETTDEKNLFNKRVIAKISEAIQYSIDNREEQNLTDSEYKVGLALLQLLDNWDNIFDNPDIELSKKYSKTVVMYYLTENTLLPIEEVRDAMKRYKLLYFIVKGDYIRNIYLGKED